MPIQGQLTPNGFSDVAVEIPTIEVVSIIRRLRGGSNGILARCDDGKLYSLRLNCNPQEPNVLANEILGSYLIRALGFQTPSSRNVVVNRSTVQASVDHTLREEWGDILPKSGVYFASEFMDRIGFELVEWLETSRLPRIANRAEFLGMYIFDVWASHQDQRQCIYRQNLNSGGYQAFFVNNRHLFGGAAWSEIAGNARRPECVHLQARPWEDRSADHWLNYFTQVIPELLRRGVNQVPAEWYTGDLQQLRECLLYRLSMLSVLMELQTVGGPRSLS